MMQELISCNICPHNCEINRLNGEVGRCKATDKVKVALASIHNFEEPCISGEKGSGTVFFSNCNLRCIFCQNYKISQLGLGKEISIEELADIFIDEQNKNVENINLVTPTMYVYQIIEAIKIARSKGLYIPIVYNSNGYENVETIKKLKGYIDIYLPDLKYSNDKISYKYSGIKHYFESATAAIKEMYNQVGNPVLDENGIMKKGLIIRHLVLPNNLQNSKDILKWINDNIEKKVFVSIMAQYFPTHKSNQFPEINRKLTKEEYEEIEDYLYSLDLDNGYIQELGEHEEEYVPDFEGG
jgi:putative pyruvate formate lyase activating enzyme